MLRWQEEVGVPIFHLSVRTHSRSAGRSAVAAAAYRAGARLRCERTGRTHDYSRRHGVVATRVVVPQSETMVSRQELWDRAEAAETRCNATVAREIEVALPAELNSEQRETLALGFATALAARYGIAVDVAVHEPSKAGDNRNHHAHLLTSTRAWRLDGTFGRKVRQLDDRRTGPAEIVDMRKTWAAMCNAALAHAGVAATVDHRSHRERGLTDEPGSKLGPAAVGLERRTGTVSRRRADQDAERAAKQIAPPRQEEKDGVGAGRDGSDRRRAQLQVLRRLRSTFVAATAAAMAGRAHPAVQGIPMSPAPQRRQGSAAPIHRSAAHRSPPAVAIGSPALIGPRIPASRAETRKGKSYDEAAAAAAMIRRVERELEAEHMTQVAAQEAEAKRAGALGDRQPLRNAFAIGFGRLQALSGAGIRRRFDFVANGPVRRMAEDQGVDRVIDIQSSPGQDVDDAPNPAVAAQTREGLARRELAVMVAHELRRRHKRSRARLSCLAEVALMEVSTFELEASARDETGFDAAAIAGEPALADLWRAWEHEDRVKQRDVGARTDAGHPTVTTGVEPTAGNAPEAGPDPGHPANAKKEREGGANLAASTVRTRRDIVIDTAILVIARGGWSKGVGDSLAGLLQTRRGWIHREAHRVCRERYGTDRPQALPAEVLRTLRQACREDAAQHLQLSRTLSAIERGRLGRGIV